jgi:AraC-like DNA-binding protein
MKSQFNKITEWEKLAQRVNYRAKDFARQSGVSMRQLQRIFRVSLDKTPQQWLNEQRQQFAFWMITVGRSAKDVAITLGYKQVSHFCREFKRTHGCSTSYLQSLYEMSQNDHTMSFSDN